jgi:hypothetical protein
VQEARQDEARASIARIEAEQREADAQLNQAQRRLFDAREVLQAQAGRTADAPGEGDDGGRVLADDLLEPGVDILGQQPRQRSGPSGHGWFDPAGGVEVAAAARFRTIRR